jgi:pimeloyl-ACP methyl ester carboxylesterase
MSVPDSTAGDAVLAGLCSAVYERDRDAREAAIRALDCEPRQWIAHGGSEAVMVLDPDRDRLVCALRGTEVTGLQWRDLAANVGWPSPWAGPGRAHTGYVRQLDRILDRLAHNIRRTGWSVVLTGHSMGGALATLLAARLWWRQSVRLGAYGVTEVITFGAPKALDCEGAEGLCRYVDMEAGAIRTPTRRYVVAGDPAPFWPPIPGLVHPGPAIRLPAPRETRLLERGWRGVWPMLHHDVDTYAAALAEASADG